MIDIKMYSDTLNSQGKTVGQVLKKQSDMVVQRTFMNDLATRQCYIYDYFHDDQKDKRYGYNPSLSETKTPVILKFIIKEYKTMSKDDPEAHIMFEPDAWNSQNCVPDYFYDEYGKFDVSFPIGLFVDIPDDRGVYHKWLITYVESANQNPKFGVVRCNYEFMWIEDDGFNRIKRRMWGVERAQNSYTSCGTEMYNTARCIWKHCSVFLRICWNFLRATTLKQRDEICSYGIV